MVIVGGPVNSKTEEAVVIVLYVCHTFESVTAWSDAVLGCVREGVFRISIFMHAI